MFAAAASGSRSLRDIVCGGHKSTAFFNATVVDPMLLRSLPRQEVVSVSVVAWVKPILEEGVGEGVGVVCACTVGQATSAGQEIVRPLPRGSGHVLLPLCCPELTEELLACTELFEAVCPKLAEGLTGTDIVVFLTLEFAGQGILLGQRMFVVTPLLVTWHVVVKFIAVLVGPLV